MDIYNPNTFIMFQVIQIKKNPKKTKKKTVKTFPMGSPGLKE